MHDRPVKSKHTQVFLLVRVILVNQSLRSVPSAQTDPSGPADPVVPGGPFVLSDQVLLLSLSDMHTSTASGPDPITGLEGLGHLYVCSLCSFVASIFNITLTFTLFYQLLSHTQF